MEPKKLVQQKHKKALASGDKSGDKVVSQLQKRIAEATKNGGLVLSRDAAWEDWETYQSENYYERLYLDKTQELTDGLVKKNYKIITEFWQQKINDAASSDIIKDRYGAALDEAIEQIEEAYNKLKTFQARKEYNEHLNQKRLEKGKKNLLPLIDIATDDKILSPSEEKKIYQKGFSYGLSKNEIAIILEEEIERKQAKRGEKVVDENLDVFVKRERDNFRREVVKKLEKSYKYGFPVNIQNKLEESQDYILSKEDRRRILSNLEQTKRKKSEEHFYSLVKKYIIFGTLIPEIRRNLEKEGRQKYILTKEKNEISLKGSKTQTYDEIIDSLCKNNFYQVIENKVKKFIESHKINENLRQEFNLNYTAYISQGQIEQFVKTFKPQTEIQQEEVLNAFKKAIDKLNLKVIPNENVETFEKELWQFIQRKSDNYKLKLKEWYDNKFEEDMKKVAQAFGIDTLKSKEKINEVPVLYKKETLPRWGTFWWNILGFSIGFGLFRFLVVLYGYKSWIFYNHEIKLYNYVSFAGEIMRWNRAWQMSKAWGWIPFAIIFIIIWFIISSSD